MINFNTEIGGFNFEFKTMNIREWKLFQVYVSIEGVKRRFHMAGNEQGFSITDSFPEIKALEQELSDAILQQKRATV
ncbi:hypothetical protein F0L74_12685 [Chitinophaga agrisoli]|uniref:Uncharacterized protein n=1 Tax=Chitinophaga agrisoli TaxID=2607653 RepID=A0A5B2VU73_9BACT|nr:hypothetical protein [Chitinophaga agrisoli]KAA2243353.1 hypothetical protein F0L74_12685 [Chitinophaga agrisoli]